MAKFISSTFTVMFLFFFATAQNNRFKKYRAVETYEIRPGILMMPRYSDDGQVCEIEIEKRHYLNEKAFLGSTIPREVFTQIADELAPANERGPLDPNLGTQYLSAYAGNGITTFAEYRNISILIFGIQSPSESAGDVVEVISWKNRKCR
jgi:hypothetical protein